VYCLPPEGLPSAIVPSHYLTRQELTRFVRLAGALGIGRIRLTGGEPLLRDDLVDIVESLKKIPTVRDLSLTTNGSRLEPLLAALKKAGLDRLTVSLDSLDPRRFEEVTLSKNYLEVIQAIFSALKMGFPVKLNMVVLKGVSAEEIVRYVRMAVDYPFEVRFLEFMPLCGTGWRPEWVWPIAKVRSVVREHFELLEDDKPRGDGTAQVFRIKDGKGKVGFIASLTESFCGQCSRLRLSADGKIKPCLFSDLEIPIKELLRSQAPDEEIFEAIRQAVRIKPKGNYFYEQPFEAEKMKDGFQTTGSSMIRMIGG
jgi:cyclic pyranopterin phosphate synthase